MKMKVVFINDCSCSPPNFGFRLAPLTRRQGTPPRVCLRTFALVTAVACLLVSPTAYAVDTTEPYAPGLSDVEFYAGADGSAGRGEAGRVNAASVVGYGITERFGAYVGAAFDDSMHFDDPAGEFALGVLGSPVSSRHLDLDLLFDALVAGPALDIFALRPSFELTLNSHSDMSGFGVFVLGAFPVTRDPLSKDLEVDLTGTAGAYLRVHPRHELLAAYRMAYHTRVTPGVHQLEIQDVALGYNVVVSSTFELITDLHLDVPQDGQEWCIGGYLGVIATLADGE